VFKRNVSAVVGRNEDIDENHLKGKIVVRIGGLETEIQTRNLTDS